MLSSNVSNNIRCALAAVTVSFCASAAIGDALSETYFRSLEPSNEWELPSEAPAAKSNQDILFIAATLRNSGILSVAEGVVEAGAAIDWNITVEDARGSEDTISALLSKALDNPPAGLVLGGFDAKGFTDVLGALNAKGTSIVGWHSGPLPGPINGTTVFTNITTDPLDVARTAAQHAIFSSSENVGAVIFTDDRFDIALAKSDEMARVINRCGKCRVLETVNVALDETANRMPIVVDELIAKYGDAWNVSLGINDLYFDDAIVAFSLAGIAPMGQIVNISAGDGSVTAYRRIRLGNYQAATVPEPLNFQGWQIVDELNRAMAGEPESGFVAPTKLVVQPNVDTDGGQGNIFDPDNGYRQHFLNAWKTGR